MKTATVSQVTRLRLKSPLTIVESMQLAHMIDSGWDYIDANLHLYGLREVYRIDENVEEYLCRFNDADVKEHDQDIKTPPTEQDCVNYDNWLSTMVER